VVMGNHGSGRGLLLEVAVQDVAETVTQAQLHLCLGKNWMVYPHMGLEGLGTSLMCQIR